VSTVLYVTSNSLSYGESRYLDSFVFSPNTDDIVNKTKQEIIEMIFIELKHVTCFGFLRKTNILLFDDP